MEVYTIFGSENRGGLMFDAILSGGPGGKLNQLKWMSGRGRCCASANFNVLSQHCQKKAEKKNISGKLAVKKKTVRWRPKTKSKARHWGLAPTQPPLLSRGASPPRTRVFNFSEYEPCKTCYLEVYIIFGPENPEMLTIFGSETLEVITIFGSENLRSVYYFRI